MTKINLVFLQMNFSRVSNSLGRSRDLWEAAPSPPRTPPEGGSEKMTSSFTEWIFNNEITEELDVVFL